MDSTHSTETQLESDETQSMASRARSVDGERRRVGQPLKRAKLAPSYDAIVIGSGIGGLSAASLLSTMGRKRVLVLERHFTAGGFTHVFKRGPYEWDVGLHYVGDVLRPDAQVRRVFDAVTDGSLEWASMGSVYDRVQIGDAGYDFVRGRENLRASLLESFPNESRVIDAYFRAIDEAMRFSKRFFMEKAIPGPIAWAIGGLLRRGIGRIAGRTTKEVLSGITSNPRLAAVLTGRYMNYGLSPSRSSFLMHAIVVDHYLDGGGYPVGGSARIAQAIAPMIEAGGGAIVTSAAVRQILVDGKRATGVELADGTRIAAPIVVSTAGIPETISHLLPESASELMAPLKARVEKLPRSTAHACLYVGLKGSAKKLGLSPTQLWIHGGDDHDAAMDRFMANRDAPFPVVMISSSAAKDPEHEARSKDHSTLEMIAPVPYAWFEQWKDGRWGHRGDDYDAMKKNLERRLVEVLERQLPQVRGAIDHLELSTPLTTTHFTGHSGGQIYGIAATPERFLERGLKPATPIGGLFFGGVDVGALGVAGGLMGGVLTASAILRRDLLSKVSSAEFQAQRKTRGSEAGLFEGVGHAPRSVPAP